MKVEYQDRIDDYLLGRMTDDDRLAFEAEVAETPELQDQLSYTKNVRAIINSRNEKLDKMHEWKDDYIWKNDRIEDKYYRATGSGFDYFPPTACACNEAPTIKHRMSRRLVSGSLKYWMSGIAAVLVLGFFILPGLFSGSTEMSPSFVDIGSFRSGSGYSEIEQMIIHKQYKEALIAIDDSSMALGEKNTLIVHDLSQNDEVKEYRMLLVAEKKDDLSWLKVQALLGLDRKEEARELLNELREKEGYYQLKADSIYNVIR